MCKGKANFFQKMFFFQNVNSMKQFKTGKVIGLVKLKYFQFETNLNLKSPDFGFYLNWYLSENIVMLKSKSYRY